MRKCEYCGAHLDPQEICDCRQDSTETLACVTPPVITENIASVAAYVGQALEVLEALPWDKDGCASAKAIRADLRKRFEQMEQQRKAVKQAVMEPYNAAEKKYRALVADPMRAADEKFKAWIDSYQNEVKQARQAELEEYFYELCAALHIDFVTFADTGVKVDMATANLQDPRKARNTIHDFLNRVEDDLRTISGMENAAEVLAEYKLCKSLATAIAAVNERNKRQASAEQLLQQHRPPEQEAKPMPVLSAPVTEKPEPVCKCTFTVKATKTQLKKLKEFMNTEGISYE